MSDSWKAMAELKCFIYKGMVEIIIIVEVSLDEEHKHILKSMISHSLRANHGIAIMPLILMCISRNGFAGALGPELTPTTSS